MKSGNGSCRWKRTRAGLTISTSRTRSLSTLPTLERWKLNFTSSAVNGSPLWNFSPSRSLKSYVSPSLDIVHDSARLGVMRLPGIGFTTASCSAYNTQNGVRKPPVTSPGSNHAGASVTYRAQRSSPSGFTAARGCAAASDTKTASRTAIINAFIGLSSSAGLHTEGRHHLAREPGQLLQHHRARRAQRPGDHHVLQAGIARLQLLEVRDDVARRSAEPRAVAHAVLQRGRGRRLRLPRRDRGDHFLAVA